MEFPEHYPEFFTATILEWKFLLKPDKFKGIIVDSLSFLVKDGRTKIYGFVIMDNHIHIIWQPKADHTPEKIQHSFLKFTAQSILKDLRSNHPAVLAHFYVGATDRKYQIWERNPLGIEIRNNDTFNQKLDYMHHNPVRAGLCQSAEEYRYSSASFYTNNQLVWNWLTKWGDELGEEVFGFGGCW